MKPRYLVSACLAGENCRYDGKSNFNERVAELVQNGFAVLICPEFMGGLAIPRSPAEIIKDKVINKDGIDVTEYYNEGAKKSLELAKQHNIHKAILKAHSPSCGKDKVYDGTFSHTLIEGEGITAKLLKENKISIIDEHHRPIYDAIVLAAGKGDRSKLPYNKMLHFSDDTYVFEKAIEPFLADFNCNKIIAVCNEDEIEIFKAMMPYKKIEYVVGGNCRQESVYHGLKQVTSNYVLIHDGARANLSDELLELIVDSLVANKKTAIPYIEKSLDNHNDLLVANMALQTPQGFKTSLIKEVYERLKDHLDLYRDDSSMYKDCFNSRINYIKGDENNFKITEPNDVKRWEEIYKKEKKHEINN